MSEMDRARRKTENEIFIEQFVSSEDFAVP